MARRERAWSGLQLARMVLAMAVAMPLPVQTLAFRATEGRRRVA
jgi:hypothetical protein